MSLSFPQWATGRTTASGCAKASRAEPVLPRIGQPSGSRVKVDSGKTTSALPAARASDMARSEEAGLPPSAGTWSTSER